jgi:hypothetical protein
MLLEEWFADRRLYHLVGYLIWAGEDVNALRALAAGDKPQIESALLTTRLTLQMLSPEPYF